jgi:hypothetical protein
LTACAIYAINDDVTDDLRPFTVPLPPGFPPPHGDHVVFIQGEAPGDGPREHEDIMLRRVPRETAMLFRAAAGGRGMTHAQYLAALVDLHGQLRARADAGDDAARELLDALGLQTVAV